MSTKDVGSIDEAIAVEKDWFLQNLVNIVNGGELGIGITIQVSGMLVSGYLVSEAKYFKGFADDFASPYEDNPEAATAIKESFSKYGDIYKNDEAQDDHPLLSLSTLKMRVFSILQEAQFLIIVAFGGVGEFLKLVGFHLAH
ncbi:MAG: hypothetical protein FDZ72_16945 [Betaproteobacteria bacterium]|nr:MAG: hypothetical protein FDZ72_16945 [Betaproteobacteria bacterium]